MTPEQNFLIDLMKYLLLFIVSIFGLSTLRAYTTKPKPDTKTTCTTDTCKYHKKCVCRTCINNAKCGMPYTACQLHKKEDN